MLSQEVPVEVIYKYWISRGVWTFWIVTSTVLYHNLKCLGIYMDQTSTHTYPSSYILDIRNVCVVWSISNLPKTLLGLHFRKSPS